MSGARICRIIGWLQLGGVILLMLKMLFVAMVFSHSLPALTMILWVVLTGGLVIIRGPAALAGVLTLICAAAAQRAPHRTFSDEHLLLRGSMILAGGFSSWMVEFKAPGLGGGYFFVLGVLTVVLGLLGPSRISEWGG